MAESSIRSKVGQRVQESHRVTHRALQSQILQRWTGKTTPSIQSTGRTDGGRCRGVGLWIPRFLLDAIQHGMGTRVAEENKAGLAGSSSSGHVTSIIRQTQISFCFTPKNMTAPTSSVGKQQEVQVRSAGGEALVNS